MVFSSDQLYRNKLKLDIPKKYIMKCMWGVKCESESELLKG